MQFDLFTQTIPPVINPAIMTAATPSPATFSQEDIYALIYGNGLNNPATIVLHEDGGHAWLQVPHTLINKLGIGPKITGYSYRDTVNAYLEEDCDLSLFLNTLGISPGSELNRLFFRTAPRLYKEHSPIRQKASYKRR